MGFLEVLEASDPSLLVDCLPVRSAIIQHVDFDVLLKTVPKNLVLRQGGGRLQDGSSGRQWRERLWRERPRMHKNLNVIAISFKGVLVIWAVITKYLNE